MAKRKWWRVIGPLAVILLFLQLYIPTQGGSKAREAFKEYCAQNHLDYSSYMVTGPSIDAFTTSWAFYIPPGITPPGFKPPIIAFLSLG